MLQISNLSISYPKKTVLEAINLSLAPGTIAVLSGANGCGKSTLLSAISGVIPEHIAAELNGSVTLDGKDLRSIPLREKYHYLWHALSEPDVQFFFPTCEAELAFALENKGLAPAEIRERVQSAAADFGISHELNNSPLSLSGGQKRLLLCAIGKALAPGLYLLDEPASGLSGKSMDILCQWLVELKQQGSIVLLAEHSPRIIALADIVIPMDGSHAQV